MGGGGGREAANEVCQGKHKAGRKGRTGRGGDGEAGSGKQAITAVTISVVIMMSQSAVRPRPRPDPLQLHWFGSPRQMQCTYRIRLIKSVPGMTDRRFAAKRARARGASGSSGSRSGAVHPGDRLGLFCFLCTSAIAHESRPLFRAGFSAREEVTNASGRMRVSSRVIRT